MRQESTREELRDPGLEEKMGWGKNTHPMAKVLLARQGGRDTDTQARGVVLHA